MSTVTGTVEKIHANAKAYNIVVNDEWYGYGFKTDGEPNFNEGDTISFDFKANGKFKNINKSSIQVNPAAASTGGATSSGSATRVDTRQLAIQYQSSRNAAIQLAGVMLEAGALPLPAKKGDQYDAVIAVVDDLTNKFHCECDAVVENGGITFEDFGAGAAQSGGFEG